MSLYTVCKHFDSFLAVNPYRGLDENKSKSTLLKILTLGATT